mmetsp:Transcript_22283/g.40364  ORF Transcript_22283/g.40364 Transcript_22283/m.40364 type:complete len:356 (+) Transcript_22283:58-1125(+)
MALRPIPYSNAGRYCDEKYNSSKQEAEVLVGSSRKFRPKNIVASFSQPVLRKVEDNVEASWNPTQTQETVKKQSSAFVRQTREQFFTATCNKDKVPPTGYYTVSYQATERRSPSMKWLPDKPKEVDKKDTSPEPRVDDEEPRRSLKSVLSFRKQLPRPSITSQGRDVNEERFKSINWCPSVSSLHHRVMTPSMKKCLPRDNRTFKTQEFLPNYSPKFDFIMKDLGKTGMAFQKQLSKPGLEIKSMNDLVYEHIDTPILKRRVSSPDFSRTTSRQSLGPVPLPTFMCHTASRLSLHTINHKMLAMNHYSDGEFQTVYSDFTKSLPMSPKNVAFVCSLKTSRSPSPQRKLSPRKVGF